MLSLHFTLPFLFIIEATAWPTGRLHERDNKTDAGGGSSDNMSSGNATSHDLAMKAYAFNLGYTALSANDSCAGKLLCRALSSPVLTLYGFQALAIR